MTEEERLAAEKAEQERLAALAKTKDGDSEMIAKLVQEKVDEQLKDIKGKLNNAFTARDEAMAKAAKLEQEQKEANIKKLQDDGKHAEALELQLAEERAARKALETRNTELSRDVSVRTALNGLNFRNDRAAEIAFKEVIGNLKKNDDGTWSHKSGISISEYISAFAKDEEQSFLFKAKSNNGGGSSNQSGNSNNSTQSSSLFNLSQAEVLKLAEQGKLPNQRK